MPPPVPLTDTSVPLAPVPSAEELIRLYEAGELSAELARHHEMVDGKSDPFIERCIGLHNDGHINLIDVPSQPAFRSVTGHAFFTAQHLYCEAIPRLSTSARALMACCHILIDQAGGDGAATQPHGAFHTWCRNNPSGGATVIREARAGDELAKRFATFALQASGDIASAIDFVEAYTDDRRISGMMALAGMTFSGAATARSAIAALEPFIADDGNDLVRSHALVAALDILRKSNDTETVGRLIEAASRKPGPATLNGLARIMWLHHDLLNSQTLRTALIALENINPENSSTMHILDMGLRRLLGTENEPIALDFLTVKLRDIKLSVDYFQITAHELTHGNVQRLFELIVRWFLSGSIVLCSNINELVGIDNRRAFDVTVQPLGLTPTQQFFLCRKAVGFLFVKPVACCSIIVSVLRAGNTEIAGPASDLLFDPLLLSYGGDTKEYLRGIPPSDPAYGPVRNALAKEEEFCAGLDAIGTIKEIQPSDYQRDVARQLTYDEMQTARKNAESKSVLLNVIRRSTVLYGRRSLTYVTNPNGGQRAVAIDLKSISTSIELPRLEVLDPVGLSYMLRAYQVEKLE